MSASESQRTDRSTTEVIVVELTHVLEPITEAATAADSGDPEPLQELLDDLGVGEAIVGESAGAIEETVTGAASAAESLLTFVESVSEGDLEPGAIKEAIDAVKTIIETIRELNTIKVGPIDVESLGDAVLDLLLVSYLEQYHGRVYNAGRLTGIIVEHTDKPDEFRFDQISTLLSDPNSIPAELFDWGSEDFRSMVVLHYVRGMVWEFGLPADFVPPTELGQSAEAIDELSIPVLVATTDMGVATTGVRVVPMPGNGGLPGLAVVPFGSVATSEEFGLGNGWTFNVATSGKLDDWGLTVYPDKKPALESVEGEGSSSPGKLHGEGELSFDPSSGSESAETTLLGNPAGSRLAVKQVSLKAAVHYEDEEVVFEVALPVRGTMGVHPTDFDGFLAKVLPGDGIFYDFDATVGWSSKEGLFFERGGTLEAAIPQTVALGPFNLSEVYLAALSPDGDGGGGTISLAGAGSGDITLGPFTGTVKRIGIEADFSFPENKDGSLGVVDLDLGFKPPDGLGLSIDAGAVSGGGYLEFDPENERYAGVLQLKASDLTINAIGLLTTELPGGRDGFSLLLIITGEFPPVQLGFGFTLNGVGGLVGVNRSMKAKPLGTAVREGSMNSILFPENPVANSQRIISDLRTIFPPTSDVYVFGPMAKLGWGTPTLITADLGVVLEIPTWKIAILGRLSTLLPDEKAALIELNLAVVGILDPPNKRFSLDATLYDSRVLAWSLSGDMAMRSNWGDNPRFVLSVGGWNPRFDPPNDFPELDRVKASLGPPGGNPLLELKGYFAVTSNTVQAGAGIHLLAEAGPAKVEGRLAFDALIQFDPFKFIVDILASLSVTIKGHGLSIKLDGTLMGPSPFRVKGKITIKILFIKIKAKVDVTIGSGGEKEKLPPAHIMPKLTEELGKPGNWSAQRPETATGLVTFRELETDDETVLAHPLGRVGVRQTIVPLDFEIEKFGNARPAGYTTFTVAGVTVGGAAIDLGDATTEQFAPAQYTQLSDSEKIDSPAFEAQRAGRQMRHGGITLGYTDEESRRTNVRSATLAYESSVIDKTKDNWATPLAQLGRFQSEGLDATSTIDQVTVEALADVSAVANSPARAAGEHRFRLDPAARERHYAHVSGVAGRIVTGEPAGDADPATEPPVDAVDDGVAENGEPAPVRRGGASPDVGGLATNISMGESGYVVASTATLEQVSIPTAAEEPMSKVSATRALSRYADADPERARELQVVPAGKATSRRGASTVGGGSP